MDVSMDFALGLPKKKGVNSILVIEDRFSIMGRLISCHKTDDASHSTELYFREVVNLYGAQMTILSDWM